MHSRMLRAPCISHEARGRAFLLLYIGTADAAAELGAGAVAGTSSPFRMIQPATTSATSSEWA